MKSPEVIKFLKEQQELKKGEKKDLELSEKEEIR